MKRLTQSEALKLLQTLDLKDLGIYADEVKNALHPSKDITFVIDRNINYTNVCINRCKFCAFYKDRFSPHAYVLTKTELFKKIEETLALSGTQILLQGGLNPELSLDFYTDLLSSIKSRFNISIHGFSPSEIAFIAKSNNLSIKETLQYLKSAGLDSIPGGGAEILSDRVRKILSPNKINSDTWLSVMREAHLLGMKTTATMMFGSIETPEEIILHLDKIRALQDETGGFTAFIPWTFQPDNTEFIRMHPEFKKATAVDYLRVLAISRLYLDNIVNIQASWVTQGLKIAQLALRFGANDFGSTMIEENVVRSAGVTFSATLSDIITAIKSAGFAPVQRNTLYEHLRRF